MSPIHGAIASPWLKITIAGAAVIAAVAASVALISPSTSAMAKDSTTILSDSGSSETTVPAAVDTLPVAQKAAAAETSTSAFMAQLDYRPNLLVAASKEGRLVLIDTKTGKTTKILTTVAVAPTGTCGSLGGKVSLSADKQSVYFDVLKGDWTEGCQSEIRNILINGGASTFVTDGFSPVASPDGKTLSYLRKNVVKTALDDGLTADTISYDVMVRNVSDHT